MSDENEMEGGRRQRKPFKTYTWRGLEMEKLMDLSNPELMQLLTARARRRFKRGNVDAHLLKRLRKAKKNCVEGEKPAPIKTHLRNAIVLPEMVTSQIGVYNGKQFGLVEVKPHMIGHYLGEFCISYQRVGHGRPGIGAANAARFIPIK